MALYIGSQRVTPLLGENYTWWGGKNAAFLYEAAATFTLNDTEWNDKKSSITTSSATSFKYNPTTYSAAANDVIYDKWGTDYHSGTDLNFAEYNYFVLIDVILNAGYTEDEATMGSPHTVKCVASMVSPLFQLPYYENNAANQLIVPVDGANGHFNYIGANLSRIQYRQANGRLMAVTPSYGIYVTSATPTLDSTTTAGTSKPSINFRTPTISCRANTSQFALENVDKINPSTTTIRVRQRLYQVEKSNYAERLGLRFADIFTTNNFPVEPI